MLRIFPALCLLVLLARPSFGAEVTDEFCRENGLANARQNWSVDPEETRIIASSSGKISRDKSALRFSAGGLTFHDMRPDVCTEADIETYKLEEIVGDFAIVRGNFYEEVTSFLVDLRSGRKAAIAYFKAALSPNQRYLVFQHQGWLGESGVLVLDLAGSPRYALIEPTTVYPSDGGFNWIDNEHIRVDMISYTDIRDNVAHPESAGTAEVLLTSDGIKLRIAKTGEELEAPFLPLEML